MAIGAPIVTTYHSGNLLEGVNAYMYVLLSVITTCGCLAGWLAIALWLL